MTTALKNPQVFVNEDSFVGSVIIKLKDYDVTKDMTSYHLKNHRDLFSVGRITGEVVLIAELDYEDCYSYQLNIVGLMARNQSSTFDVRLSVRDVNDNLPIFIHPPRQNMKFTTTAVGQQSEVLQLKAMDLDSGSNGEVSYRWVNTKPEVFQLDSTSGQIHQLANQTTGSYELTVQAYDHGKEKVMASQISFTIQIIHEPPISTEPIMYAPISVTLLLAIILFVVTIYLKVTMLKKKKLKVIKQQGEPETNIQLPHCSSNNNNNNYGICVDNKRNVGEVSKIKDSLPEYQNCNYDLQMMKNVPMTSSTASTPVDERTRLKMKVIYPQNTKLLPSPRRSYRSQLYQDAVTSPRPSETSNDDVLIDLAHVGEECSDVTMNKQIPHHYYHEQRLRIQRLRHERLRHQQITIMKQSTLV